MFGSDFMGKTFIIHSPVERGFIERDSWKNKGEKLLKKHNLETDASVINVKVKNLYIQPQ